MSTSVQAHWSVFCNAGRTRTRHLPTSGAGPGLAVANRGRSRCSCSLFLLQPFLIPSESMERTLLVGDFLLFNKQIYAPAGRIASWLLPYRPVQRGDIVVFHHAQPPMLIKRVVGLPGDRLRITKGQVFVNGAPLDEPYAAFEPAPLQPRSRQLPRRYFERSGFSDAGRS